MATGESSVQDPEVDETVLVNPEDYTVDEVLAVFARSSQEQIDTAKEIEAQGKNRAGIMGFEKPAPSPSQDGEPTFSRERLLSREGEQITGYPHTVIVAALHGDDADEFTRAEVQAKADAFLKRPVEED